MENKKLIEERRIECVDYIEENGKCFHLGKYSGRCFKYLNPLLLCKEIKKGRIQLKE